MDIKYLKDIYQIRFILEYWFIVIPVTYNDSDFFRVLLIKKKVKN